jgi:hypothetical protein
VVNILRAEATLVGAMGVCANCVVLLVVVPNWCGTMLARQGDIREDLPHFVLECPAYDHIREHYAVLFGGHVGPSVAQRLEAVFDHDDQVMLAKCLWQMDVYRNDLMG